MLQRVRAFLSVLRCRTFFLTYRFYGCGPSLRISRSARIRDPRFIRLGRGVKVESGADLWAFHHHPDGAVGAITVREDSDIRSMTMLHTYGGWIEIGVYTCVNHFSFINGAGGVTIGDRVLIGPHCVILSADHHFERSDQPIVAQGLKLAPVVIEDDAYLGAGVIVLPGTRIGRGAVVGAGTVVSRDVPAMSVTYGVPGRSRRMRG